MPTPIPCGTPFPMLDFIERYAAIKRKLGANTGIVDPEARAPVCRDVGRIWDDDTVPPPVKVKKKKERVKPILYTGNVRRHQVVREIDARLADNAVPVIKNPREWQEVVNQISQKTGVTYAEMRGRSRNSLFSAARWECWYLLKTELNFSFKMIAEKFGRDHSTVFHGISRYCEAHGLPMPDGYWSK